MELTNEFHVGISMAQAWTVLTNLERIGPMMPGAQLQEVEGDEYRGVVKVKVGPIKSEYKGIITFVERDEAAGRVVLRASGRDIKGQGNVNALITATMTPDGDLTKVSMVTDLSITGKVAQFGRGVLADVSSKLIDQFVEALEADLRSSSALAHDGSANVGQPPHTPLSDVTSDVHPDASAAGRTSGSGARHIDSPEARPVDLLDVASGSMSRFLLRPALVMGAVVMMVLRHRHRSQH